MLPKTPISAPVGAPPAPTPRVASLKERRARNREQMIATILDCARDIMRESGVQSLSINLLAKSVGIQPPSLYEYFENRNAIFDALYAMGLEIFQDSVLTDIDQLTNFREAVRHIYDAELAFSRAEPELYQIIFNNALPGYVLSEHNRLKVRTGLDKGIGVLRRLLSEQEHTLPISAEEAALLVDIVISGVVTRLINLENTTSDAFRAQYEMLVDAMIKLLSSDPERPDK